MAFERRAYVVRHHLETAADDGLVGAAQDPQEAVCVDSGHVGGLHPLGGRSELSGFDLQQPGLVGTQRRTVVVDDPQLRAETGFANAAALVLPVLLVVRKRPTGDTATEFSCGVGRQDRDAETWR
jgi:hypothetical protein